MSFARAQSNQTCIVDLTRTSLTRGCLCWRDLSRLSLVLIAAPTFRATPVMSRQERCTKSIRRLTACDIWLGADRQQRQPPQNNPAATTSPGSVLRTTIGLVIRAKEAGRSRLVPRCVNWRMGEGEVDISATRGTASPRLRGEGRGVGPLGNCAATHKHDKKSAPHPGPALLRADPDRSPQAGRGNWLRRQFFDRLSNSGDPIHRFGNEGLVCPAC